MQLKTQFYYSNYPHRQKAITYLNTLRDDRRVMLRNKARFEAYIPGMRSPNMDGMPKSKSSKNDPVGDAVVERKHIVNEYTRSLIEFAGTHTDVMETFKRAGISDFVRDMMIERYCMDVPIKNICVKHMYERTKVYRILNQGLDDLYEALDEEWK